MILKAPDERREAERKRLVSIFPELFPKIIRKGNPMPDAFRLAAKDCGHASWMFSVTQKTVYIIAYNEEEARRLVGDSLYCEDMVPAPGKYEKTIYPPSPWRLPDVTSCERDASELPRDGIHIVAEDGEKWVIKH